MSKEIPTSLFSVARNYAENNFSQILSFTVITIVVLTTFLFQGNVIGLEGGFDEKQPNHHGWVTANTIAIINRATPENFFVGYALASRDDQNKIHYEYFDRYPVFFSAIFNRILILCNSLAEEMVLARQVMNFIFLSTLIVAFLILDKLTGNKPLALTATLLAFSNPFLLWYKDMVHFDQPALFGFLLLIYALALYKLEGRKTPLYIATFVAIGLGRGYASYSILILWLAFETFLILRKKGLILKEKFNRILKHPSFLVLVIAIAWGGSLLTYNIVIEAHKRDVSILQTSIIRSARYRLSLNPEFNQENEEVINWPDFVKGQVSRIIQWSFPVKGVNFGFSWDILLLTGMFAVMGVIVRRQSVEKRMIYLILMLSGFFWLFPLKNLSAFHDYTAMYYIGIPLVFFLSVFTIIRLSKTTPYFLLIAGVILYVTTIVQVRDWHAELAGNANAYIYDFDRILEKIDGTGNNVNMAEGIPYGPFTSGFYLSEQYLSSRKVADYVVSRDKKKLPDNLTPDNEVIYLFKK